MFIDKRSMSLLTYLAKQDTYVTIKALIEKFNISRRTVYYDIGKINGWLEDRHLPAVKYVRSTGFKLEDETREAVLTDAGTKTVQHYELSQVERKGLLAIYLMSSDKALYLESLMERTRVSRNTTIDDLKELKADLKKYYLKLVWDRKFGYLIEGDEGSKRKALIYYLQHALPAGAAENLFWGRELPFRNYYEEIDLWDDEKLYSVQHLVTATERELGIQFTDEFHYNLAFRLLLFASRAAQGDEVQIDGYEKEALAGTMEFRAAQAIGKGLSDLFRLKLPEDEIYYITKHLLSSRVNVTSAPFHEDKGRIAKQLMQVVEEMVTDFQRYACVFFEARQEIESGLLLHVKPAYYRVLYDIEAETDIASAIKEKYPDIFQLTKKVIPSLEKLTGKAASDNEVALIALHFGGWMRKLGTLPAKRKKALVVCTSGIGTSRLLQHQLEGLFSTVDIVGCFSLREYKNYENQADFIISTTDLKQNRIPVFTVSAILTENEKEELLKKVNAIIGVKPKQRSVEALIDIIGTHSVIKDKKSLQRALQTYLAENNTQVQKIEKPRLQDLLKPSHILLEDDAADWKEAIRLASRPLVESGAITEGYVQKMIDTVVKMGPYIVIAPGVAIPHAKPEDGVEKLGLSLLRLKNGIAFSGQKSHEVNLIVVLAAIDGDSHLLALSQLTRMMTAEGNKQQLIKAESADEIFEMIRHYSAQDQ
ncbi:BglG family transcription antiterminator [Bacillus sp. MMSF_3328]|uniref:BglG family transcription antiterminator n=1 Tax=Bacillus sp. MMSF_3328 TaxID=3047080 RepID=UPI00273F68E9|nr:BglG family transcription antiterminator [Bacillus sp. MMSF_3328]